MRNLVTTRTRKNGLYGTVAAIALACTVLGCGCSSGNAGNKAEGAAQGADTTLQEQNQPVPVFPTSAMRGEMIEIQAIQALGTPTTTFFFPMGTTVVNVSGKQVFSAPPFKTCPSQGEPIPNTASLTNPLQPYQGGVNTGADRPVVSQMDPNGLYTPSSSSGTFVLCITPSGGTKLTYWEGPVFAESGSAVWSDTTGIVDVGPSMLPVCTITAAAAGDGTGLQAGTRYYHCVKA